MTSGKWQSEDLYTLFDDLCDGSISKNDATYLDQLLRDDPNARWEYLCYMDVHAGLGLAKIEEGSGVSDQGAETIPGLPSPASTGDVMTSLPSPVSTGDVMTSLPSPVSGRGAGGEGGLQRNTDSEPNFASPASHFPPPVSIILDASDSISPLSPLPSPLYIAHPFLFSNIFASLVLSIGILGAWLYQIDIPQQIARDNRAMRSLGKITAADNLEFVGQVTGMDRVEWSDAQTATVDGANVPLGRKYAIASGLMEITYKTGAKVILQGPATYEVGSRNGGFLSVGKLAARLDNAKKSPLSPLPSPLFIIHTPNATVTDLGTEFGIVATENQQAEVHVFRGKVEVQRRDSVGHVLETVQLTENEALHFDSTSSPSQRRRASPSAFVTVIQRTQPVQPTAWYKFDNIITSLVLRTPDSSGHGRSASLLEMDRSNIVPGKSGNALAFNLDKEKLNQRVSMPWSPSFDMVGKSFTFALWLKRLKAGAEEHETILHKEGGDHGGYSIMRDRDSGKLVFRARNATGGWVWIKTDTSDEDAPKGVWVHFAVVGEFDESSRLYDVRLYRNGLRVGGHQNVEMATMPLPLSIGGLENGWAFRGMLDDVQIYHRALHDKQVMFLVQHPGELPSVNELSNPSTK